MKKILIGLLILVSSSHAVATEWINIGNIGHVQWQLYANDSKVFLRNLNEFNSAAKPCCYSYYIDISTDTGKAIWSVFLMKFASQTRLILGVEDVSEGGKITALGNW